MRTLFEDNEIWTDRIFSHPERTIRLGSLFSGIGAIEHALKRLNIKTEIQFASDIDANCKKSYFANYEISEERWCDDVHKLNAKPYRYKVDLLVGGAPCQAFSLVGKRRGFEDTRGTLFREIIRLIEAYEFNKRPKILILENVQNLINHDKGNTWKTIHYEITNAGYNVIEKPLVVAPKDVGVPQLRNRAIILAVRKDLYDGPIELEFERRRKEYEERVGKKSDKSLTILDMINISIHSSNFTYNDMLDMTLYQVKNSFDVLTKKDTYETTVMYMVSPKFEIKDKQEHWIEKIKVDKSTLS